MIYVILILFFVSLISIIVMIGRKLTLLRNGQLILPEEVPFEIPYVKELRHLTIENIKKYEHMTLVAILRIYVQASNFSKQKYQEVKNKIKIRIKKNHIDAEKAEVSNFLKLISDYTHRVREIKHKIKEEEKEL